MRTFAAVLITIFFAGGSVAADVPVVPYAPSPSASVQSCQWAYDTTENAAVLAMLQAIREEMAVHNERHKSMESRCMRHAITVIWPGV